MLRRYRGEILLFLSILVLCFVAVRALSEDAKAPAPALKPGDEVKPLELESARLGKLKAQIVSDEAQQSLLQQQYGMLENDKKRLQEKIDTLVKEIEARVKAETGAELAYDQKTGEDGTFHVNRVPSPPAPTPAKK